MKCITCGKEIIDKWKTSHPCRKRKFCSLRCYWKFGRPDIGGKKCHFWKGGKVSFRCDWCSKEFRDYRSNRVSKKIFCSRECLGKWTYKRNKQNLSEFEKGHQSWNKGMKGFQSGRNSPAWKGNNVGYFSLHNWLRRNYKVKKKCEFCGEKGKIQLANISGNYKRDMNDYFHLCVSCHIKLDRYKLSHGIGNVSWGIDK